MNLPFNINSIVRVRLTDAGRAHLRYLHAKLEAEIASHGGELTSPYKEPKEDYQGWSEWQLWDLMAAMGPKMGIACPLLFETDIQFKVNVEVV